MSALGQPYARTPRAFAFFTAATIRVGKHHLPELAAGRIDCPGLSYCLRLADLGETQNGQTRTHSLRQQDGQKESSRKGNTCRLTISLTTWSMDRFHGFPRGLLRPIGSSMSKKMDAGLVVVWATHNGHKYIKTTADDVQPDEILPLLAECPG